MLLAILAALIAVALGYLAHKKFIAKSGDNAAAAAPGGPSLKVDATQRESIRAPANSNYATAESARSTTNDVPEREASSRDVKTARFATDEDFQAAKRGDGTVDAEPQAPPVVQTRSELLRAQLADLPDSTAKNQSPIVRSSKEVKPDPATASAIAKTTSKKEVKKPKKKSSGKKK